MCCKARGALSRLGMIWGIAALATLVIAFVSGSWLHTKEPVTMQTNQVSTSVKFKIGLWKACPTLNRINSSMPTPSPPCTSIKYANWDNVRLLGDWGTSLDLTQVFINKMRSCTILCALSLVLLILAVFLALLGHCNCDSKTIVASGFFILGGLSLGTGLVVFASALSETMLEIQQYHKESSNGVPKYHYRYGWCFLAATLAFIMTKLAAVLSMAGYLNRFSSVDEMVLEMVPGAERKLLEHQRFSSEICQRQPNQSSRYDPLPPERPANRYEPELGPLLNKTPPDVCNSSSACAELSLEQTFAVAHAQTVPITIKNPGRYGTMPAGTTLHQGFLGVADLGSSSSNSSQTSGSKTLQHPGRQRKKCVKIETFQGPEVGGLEVMGKRTGSERVVGFSASAV